MILQNIKQAIKRYIFPNTYCLDAYLSYLRKSGVVLGKDVTIYAPNHVYIDTRKPYLISIGDNCKITQNVTILAHDYGVSVPRRVYGKFVGGSLPVTIGKNVFIGMNAIILKGTSIGDNCIIGANSVVKGDFPSGSVIAGNPAKVISTLENYYKKNLDNWVDDAKKCAKAIYRNSGRLPTIEEMSDGYAWLYLERTKENIEKYDYFFKLSSDDYDDVVKEFLGMKPIYSSFEDFLKDCDLC